MSAPTRPGGLSPETARLLPVVAPVSIAALALTVVALVSVADTSLGLADAVGLVVLLAAAIAAEAYPVPIEGVAAGGVSLAASFLVGAALIYDWQWAVLLSLATRVAIEVAQRRPLLKVAYNGAVFALSGAAAGAMVLLTGGWNSIGGLLITVAAAALAFYTVNVLLVALVIGRATGAALVEIVRQSLRWTAIPFVIMASISLMLEVLWARSPILAAALAGPLVAVGLYQRSVHGALEAVRLAGTDPLTGLGNHRAFHEELAELMSSASAGFALCLVDADAFKQINDRHGHQAGDDVLVLLAQHLRDAGSAFRLGGDEFAILMPGVTPDRARELARTVVTRSGGERHAWGGHVSVSAGVALAPEHAEDPDRLFAAADAALYQAKRRGRNQVHLYDPRVADLAAIRRSAAESVRLDAAWGLAELMDTADSLREDDDDLSGGHSLRVSTIAARLAARCGLEPVDVELVRLAARLHDLGKLAVPVEILRKPGELEDREWRVLEEHPETGRRILAAIGAGAIADWVLHHHERWDGTGYPAGMAGAEIPLPARIIFVADAYDAITSGRPYRDRRSEPDALDEITRCAGTQFDPAVVAALAAELAAERLNERLTA